jgi:hypothetical protein
MWNELICKAAGFDVAAEFQQWALTRLIMDDSVFRTRYEKELPPHFTPTEVHVLAPEEYPTPEDIAEIDQRHNERWWETACRVLRAMTPEEKQSLQKRVLAQAQEKKLIREKKHADI